MIRRRTPTHETKTGHERWLVSYSDFITLLFAFFVMMYSVSQVNEEKYRALSASFSSAFEGKVPVEAEIAATAHNVAASGLGSITGLSPFTSSVGMQALAAQLQQSLTQVTNRDAVSIRATAEWLEIEIKANLLFDSASAEPSREAQQIFRQVAVVLAAVPNPVEVAGHTDDLPIHTPQFKSNWELSAARASSVVRLLARGGVDPARMAAVGYGEFRPIAGNANEDERAQNRRVVLRVARVDEQAPVPMQTFNPAEWVFGGTRDRESDRPVTRAEVAPSSDAADNENVAPVRLNHGGLLFTSDPELPRKSR